MDSLQFLEKSFASAEGTIRAFDVKAQIVLATLAFSYQPVFLTLGQLDLSPGVNLRLALVFCMFCASALLFLRVLAPSSGSAPKHVRANASLFFVQAPEKIDPGHYLELLQNADLMDAYSSEVLVLQSIRRVKDRRFRQALLALCIYFAIVLLYGLGLVLRLV